MTLRSTEYSFQNISLFSATVPDNAPAAVKVVCGLFSLAGFYAAIFLIGIVFGAGFNLAQ